MPLTWISPPAGSGIDGKISLYPLGSVETGCISNGLSNPATADLILIIRNIMEKTLFLMIILKHYNMIQRMQSIYLTLVLLLALLSLFGSTLHFVDASGNAIKLMTSGSLTAQDGQNAGQVANMWPVAIILILLSLLSLIAIFLFKNRKIQLIIAIGVIIMSAGLIIALAWYGFKVISDFNLNIAPGISIAIPFLILVFSVLAYRGILKDDRLVKSYDRLR